MSRLAATMFGSSRPAPGATCGQPDNPHVVRSSAALYCEGCGTSLAPVLLARLRVAMADFNARRDAEEEATADLVAGGGNRDP